MRSTGCCSSALLLVVLWLAPAASSAALARLLPRRPDRRAAAASAFDFAGFLGSAAGRGPARSRAQHRVRRRPAAEDVSFTAEPGAVTSLIGPNGAGKTTVLNMVCGFYRPDAGASGSAARELAGAPAHAVARAGIARTYQTTQLFGSLSVLDNVAPAPSRRAGSGVAAPAPTTGATAAALLAFVGYAGALDRPAGDCRMSIAASSRSPARSPAGRGCCCSTSPPPG